MKTIRDFLEATARIQANQAPRNGYTSLDEFLLRNGREFPAPVPTPPDWVGPDYPRQCYRNAALAAKLLPRRFVYCEGYATTKTLCLPLLHAWLLDVETLQTIDPTWGQEGAEYFGIAVKLSFVRRAWRKAGHYGLIDCPRADWPLLTEPPELWRHPILDRL